MYILFVHNGYYYVNLSPWIINEIYEKINFVSHISFLIINYNNIQNTYNIKYRYFSILKIKNELILINNFLI